MHNISIKNNCSILRDGLGWFSTSHLANDLRPPLDPDMLDVPRSVHPPHGRHVHPVLGCETRFRPVFSDTLASVLPHGWTRAFNNRPMKRELPSSNGNFSSRVTYYSRLNIFRCHFFLRRNNWI